MVLLPNPNILVDKRAAYLAVWRYRGGDCGFWRNKIRGGLLERLSRVPPWSLGSGGCSSHCLPHSFCCLVCILHWKVEFPEKMIVLRAICFVLCRDSKLYINYIFLFLCDHNHYIFNVYIYIYIYRSGFRNLEYRDKIKKINVMNSYITKIIFI